MNKQINESFHYYTFNEQSLFYKSRTVFQTKNICNTVDFSFFR